VGILGVAAVQPGSEAEKAGLQQGDSILQLNNEPLLFWDQLRTTLQAHKGDSIAMLVHRAGQEIPLQVKVPDDAILGFNFYKDESHLYERITYGFWAALPVGAAKAWESLATNAKGIGKVLKGEVNPRKALAGP